jgi:hypothetical protein
MPIIDSSPIDANMGYLCLWSHWRPDPDQPDPEMPGLKQLMTTFIPRSLHAKCLCDSGKTYRACCRLERYWWAICPNPGLEGYSLLAPQSATYRSIDGAAVHKRLMADDRLHCTVDSPKTGFWSYWGDPIVETPEHGILGFGDLEIKRSHTLLVTVLSDLRMQLLIEFLDEVAGDLLGQPEHVYDMLQVIDKRTGKSRMLAPERWLKRNVGKKDDRKGRG